MLNFNNLKQKDAAIALQKAMTEGKEEDIQQAWVGFQQSIVDTVKADFAEYSMTQDKTILSPSSAGTYSSLLSERLPPVASEILSILPAFPFKILSNFASIPSNP